MSTPASDISAQTKHTPEELERFKRENRAHRYRFGVANLLFQCEESAITFIKTATLKNFGATDRHFGILGTCGGFLRLFQFLAMPLLNHYRSYYRAMRSALWVGVLAASLVAGSILLGCIPRWGTVGIWCFLGWSLLMSLATGVQCNTEVAWIGDLVPKPLLGWFTSIKYIIGVLSIAILSVVFSWLFDAVNDLPMGYEYLTTGCFSWVKAIFPEPVPHFWGFWISCLLFVVVAISHVVAIFILSKVPDRTPPEAKFISTKRSERINYRSLPLWAYVAFFIFWTGGRTAHYTLTGIFLMRVYNMSLTGMATLTVVCTIMQAMMLLFFGKVSDKWGNRRLLILVSGAVACSMFLWTLTAWTGWQILILNYLIEGMAGNTHSMLVNNYGIEIFPSKGRAAYFGVVYLILGIVCVVLSLVVGEFAHALEKTSWTMEFLGATITHYHLVFFCSTVFTLCCVIPLLIVGNRVVQPLEDDSAIAR